MKATRAAFTAMVGALAIGASAGAACTTFDGLVAGSPDATAPIDAAIDAPRDTQAALTYLDPADAGRVCAMVFKCPLLASSIVGSIAVPIDPTNFAACMDWLSGPLPNDRVGANIQTGMFQCIAKATTCQAAGECLPIENIEPSDPRCGDGGPDAAERCTDDGGTVLRCAGQYALHCDSAYYAPGAKCLKGDDGSHWCSLNTNCATPTSCVGTLLDYCGATDNLHQGINCAAEGYTCGVDVEAGVPDCLTSQIDEPCTAVGTDCEAEAVAVCDGFEVSKFDCGALGGTCSKKGGPAHCVRPTDTCTPYDATMNTCTGSKISLCVGGAPSTFDCQSISMMCVPGAGVLSGHCQ